MSIGLQVLGWPTLAARACRRRSRVLILLISTATLFGSFLWNAFGVVDDLWFAGHQKDMESFIVGRLVKSRSDGLLSDGGLLGYVSQGTQKARFSSDAIVFQYRSYLLGLDFGRYTRYDSQIGVQGIAFGALDALLPLTPKHKLSLFFALTALLSSLALAAIVLWLWVEFGAFAGMVVLLSTLGSEWLTVFGRNLWWGLWAFYLPMLATLAVCRHWQEATPRRIAAVASAAFLVKCGVNGYEYMTTTVVMALVPLIYAGITARSRLRALGARAGALVLGASVAVMLSLAILCAQIHAASGSWHRGVDHISSSLAERTHGNPADHPKSLRASLEAEILPVLATYLKGTYFQVGRKDPEATHANWRVPYWSLGVLFAMASLVAVTRRPGDDDRRPLALVVATWAGLLAPLSWFFVFKAHSFIHTHMNFIVWQMPFTLLGFAVLAVSLQRMSALLRPARVDSQH